MSDLIEYLIPYVNLKEGEHVFNYNIGDSFFENYDNTDVKSADLKVKVLFNKKSTHIEMSFEIKGSIDLNCDRCLELFNHELNIKQAVYVKFGEEESEDENLYILPLKQNEVDLSEFIDELIVVNLPMRRIHLEDEMGEPTCSNKMLDYIQNINNEGLVIDPRWNELNKLKDGAS